MGKKASRDKSTVIEHPPAEWQRPARTIILAATPRSGSTLLSDWMKQTGRLGYPFEYFGDLAVQNNFPDRGATLVDRFLLMREFGQSANGVAGIKLFPHHLHSLAKQTRISEWLGPQSWLWLRRRDALGQAISMEIGAQTQSFVSFRPSSIEPNYSGDNILNRLMMTSVANAAWSDYFARTGIKPLELTYEEVEADPAEAVRRIGRHSGIEILEETLQPSGRLQRQRTALNDEWRQRFITDFGDPDRLKWPLPGLSEKDITRFDRLPRASKKAKPRKTLLQRIRRKLPI